ncbi:MAG: MFS transporter [Bacteroidota bacterium]
METKARLSVFQKFYWGLGGFAENLANNALLSLIYPIFAVGMGISPFFIGLALTGSRIVEVITDPMIGNLSDNTKSRWGRRRPWIFIGSILMSILFVAIWFTPRPDGGSFPIVYLIAMCSLFYFAFTIWNIPYSGLGLELETDYDERTKLMIYRVTPSFIVGIAIGSLYKLTLMRDVWGGDEIIGARYVCTIIGVLMLITGIIPSLFCKERYSLPTKHEKLSIWRAMGLTFKDKSFQLLIGSAFFVFIGLFFMIPLLTYISLYYVCHGSKELMATIGMYTAFVQATTQILSMIAIGAFAKHFDKKIVLIAGLIVGIIGYISGWFLFTPDAPYLTIIPPVIINIGLCACWVLNGSFNADICDYDELKTGRRREGMYSAVFAFLTKLAIAFVSAVSSWVLVKLGFEGQDLHPTFEQLFTLRWIYIAIPVGAMVAAILCMWKYPLTKQRVSEIQEQLKQKRAEMAV